MSFSDDFNRANSATVGNGWTDSRSRGQILNNKLRMSGTGGFAENIIYAPASANFQNGTVAVVANASDISGAVPQIQARVALGSPNTGYVAYAVNGNFRIARFSGTALNQVASTAATVNTNTDYKIVFTLNGTSLSAELRTFPADTLVASISGTDSVYNRSGLTGVSSNGVGTIDYDDFSSTPAVAAGLTITTQPYRMWQRSASENASVTISGTYTGTVASIERSVNGGAWVTAIASPSGNAFSDTFTLNTGQHTVSYRFSNDTGVSATITPIGVGDIFACAGQSNISGRGDNNQTFNNSAGGVTAYLFGNDDNWKVLSDPYDINTNQVDSVSSDVSKGSWIPRFANYWLSENEVPVGFIPCAKGATTIAQWARSTSTSTLYGSMKRRIDAVGGVKAVLFHQGEWDSRTSAPTSGTVYQAALQQLASDINSDFGVDTFVVPLHVITATGYANQTVIRQAQLDAAAASAFIRIGRALTDIDLSDGDGLHFQKNDELEAVGFRMYNSYIGNDGIINLTVQGIPDGDYVVRLFDSATKDFIAAPTLTFAGGLAQYETLLSTGTAVEGYVFDGNDPPLAGATIYGVVTNG